jgi:glycosyltransferase involved in cell wall biosynthesis
MEAYVLAVAEFLESQPEFLVQIAWKRVRSFRLDPNFEQLIQSSSVRCLFVPRMSISLWSLICWSNVVHAQNAPPDVLVMATLARRPVALTIHNWNQNNSFFSKSRRIASQLASRRWYNSTFVRNTWEKVATSPTSEVVPTVSRLPHGIVPPEERRGFVFAARWIANKGLETLILAYRQADLDPLCWPLFLIGTGPLAPLVYKLLEEHPLSGVIIYGFVSEFKKAQIIRHSRWLVAPPHTSEDLGLTPIEARNVGVPSIITRDGGLPEAAGSQALICEPRDVMGLSQLLIQAASMSEAEYALRAEMCHSELKSFLRPMSFYSDQFKQLAAGR